MSKKEYLELIMEMLEKIEERDLRFIIQIYTLVYLHLKKKKK